MDQAALQFQQRNFLTRVTLTLHPDYVEYLIADGRGVKTGFNIKYETLPGPFDYRCFRDRDFFVQFPVMIVAALTLFALLTVNVNSSQLIPFMMIMGLVFAAVGLGLKRMLKKPYTVLSTSTGKLLIVQDRQRDRIVEVLQGRRRTALRKFAVLNTQRSAWAELKKFDWLCKEGAISTSEFEDFCRQPFPNPEADPLLPSVDPGIKSILH